MKFSGKKAYIIYILIAVSTLGIYLMTDKSDEGFKFVIAEKGEIIQEVSVTGKVKPVNDITLSFDAIGRILNINKKVGDIILAGETITTLENGDLMADITAAKALLRVRETELSELLRGTREEQINITRSGLEKAKQDLVNYYDDIPNVLNNAFNDADDAINKQTAQLFNNANSTSPQLSFLVNNQQKEFDVETKRLNAGNVLDNLLNTVQTLPSDSTGRLTALSSAKDDLLAISNFLLSTFSVLNYTVNLSATTKDTYQASITLARTNVAGAITSISSQMQLIFSQQVTVDKTENQLVLEEAGATTEELTRARARIDEANAGVTRAQVRLSKTLIVSPISGIISRIDIEVGETVTAGAGIVGVISNNQFEIEANIVEADIANVKINDYARLTLDAYGEDVLFMAQVIKKDPAETVIDGVTTYKTTFQFSEEDERIKSGMTANLDIVTDRRENVVMISRRAIIFKDGKKIVRIAEGDGYEEVEVELGISGVNGNVEILSGIKEGDKIITSLNNK